MNTTMREIVYTAAMFGQMDDLVELLENDSSLKTVDGKVVSQDIDADDDVLSTLNMLVRCANLCLMEIATDYVPLVTSEILVAVDGFLPFSSFSKNVLDVINVSNKGMETKYKFLPSGLDLANGRYTVEYRYLPNNVLFEGDIEYKMAMVSARIIAYGAITEYFIISGLQDDAVLWDGRYRMALINASTKSERKVKARRWI